MKNIEILWEKMNEHQRLKLFFTATIAACRLGLLSREEGNYDASFKILALDFEKMNPADLRPEVYGLINDRTVNADDDFVAVHSRLLGAF